MSKLKGSSLFFIVSLLLLISCKQMAIYDKYQPIENGIWDKHKTYYFVFDVTDISKPYDVVLKVRNNNLYPYQNLWILSSLEQPIGPVLRDTIPCDLADDFGRWYGSGISLFEMDIPVLKDYHFTHLGQYTLGVLHGMRKDSLSGLQEIGLKVVPIR